jgi:hypothetical protein
MKSSVACGKSIHSERLGGSDVDIHEQSVMSALLMGVEAQIPDRRTDDENGEWYRMVDNTTACVGSHSKR